MTTQSIKSGNRFGLVLVVGFLLAGCNALKTGSSGGTGSASGGTLGGSPNLLNASAFVGTAGIKNVNQLLRAMTTVTKISPVTLRPGGVNSALTAQYNTISPFLSADGSVASLNPAMLLSITGLAGQVCQVFLANEAATPSVLAGTGVSFSSAAWQTQFTSSTQVNGAVISALSNQFWGRAPTANEVSVLNTAIQSAASQAPGQSVPDTGSMGVQDILLVPCTVMLASPEFLSG